VKKKTKEEGSGRPIANNEADRAKPYKQGAGKQKGRSKTAE
jgi:hypothetical protein